MGPSVRAGWLASQVGKQRASAIGAGRRRVSAIAAGRRRAWAIGAALLVAAGAGGCAAASSSSLTVSGKTLAIYLSATPDSANPTTGQDVVDAEQLAFSQQGSQLGTFKLRLVKVANSTLSDNARAAIENTSSVAYLGETAPGSSADTLGITNAQDLLQVSPTDTALELTQATAAVPGAPDRYYESLKTYGRTFARVVPSTALEAKAQVQEMQAIGVKNLYVTQDGSQYGAAVAQAVRTDASGAGITLAKSATSADAMFFGGGSAASASHVLNAALGSNPSLKVFAPSALDQPSFASALSPSARSVYVSSPGFLPSGLTSGGRQFVASFKAAYGHTPVPEAIFGYQAMKSVLYALTKAGSSANDRGAVVKDFFSSPDPSSVLGPFTINSNGDTNLGPFVFSRLQAGTLVPFKSVQVQG